MRRFGLWVLVGGWSVVACGAARAADVDWAAVEKEAAALLSDYIRIDTTDPPGNERPAADFLAAKLAAEGIEAQAFDSDPGRGNVLARLRGSGGKRPIVLLSHIDVVPADASAWAHAPFGGEIGDGYVNGRGALDCKGTGAIEAMAMLVLKRSGTILKRDVVLLATADEEVGGQRGAGWTVREKWDELGDPEYVLNEGGSIHERDDGKRAYDVGVVEKTPLWLRLTARGEPGHGSTPRGESAVARLVRALDRVRKYEPRLQVTPEVDRYFQALSELYDDGKVRRRFSHLRSTIADAEQRRELMRDPGDAALVRNTISMTVLQGSNKTNVLPATASAELDCRLLPGEDPDAFVERLRSIVADDGLEFTVLMRFPPSSSPTDTDLYRAIEKVAAADGLHVLPNVLRGFTDSHYFRERGVASYGFIPIETDEEDERTVHGIDERISLDNLRDGTRRLIEILKQLDALDAAEPPPAPDHDY
jgi:acetylornithine deacetylase/succinyl-diaminopimelate desuccinylase-like protein